MMRPLNKWVASRHGSCLDGKEGLLNGDIVLDEEAFDAVLDEVETTLQKCAAKVCSDGVSPDQHLVMRVLLTDVEMMILHGGREVSSHESSG